MKKLTEFSNLDILNLLRSALIRVSEGNAIYVCDAIRHAAGHYCYYNSDAPVYEDLTDLASDLKRKIGKSIPNCFGVDDWLKQNHYDFYLKLVADHDFCVGDAMKTYRKEWLKAWISNLIESGKW